MKHVIRSVKYLFLLLAILCSVALFMNFTGEIKLTSEEYFAIFMDNNGALKLALMVVLAAIYPFFGFVKRDVEGSVVENREQIITAMHSSGFDLKREQDGKMIFRANTIFRRVAFLFEDEIEVTQNEDSIHIEGIRRGVVYATYCLDGFIANSKRGN